MMKKCSHLINSLKRQLVFESTQFLLDNGFVPYRCRGASTCSHMEIMLELRDTDMTLEEDL